MDEGLGLRLSERFGYKEYRVFGRLRLRTPELLLGLGSEGSALKAKIKF